MKVSVRVMSILLMVLLLSVNAFAGKPELAIKPALTLSVAKAVAKAAQAYAIQNDWKVIIAIVDDGGHLVYFQREDGVQLGSIDIAIQKAETAVRFKRPSGNFEKSVADGRMALLALPNGIPFEGGVPLIHDGMVIGAIGVSGVTAQQDGLIAQAGADALNSIIE